MGFYWILYHLFPKGLENVVQPLDMCMGDTAVQYQASGHQTNRDQANGDQTLCMQGVLMVERVSHLLPESLGCKPHKASVLWHVPPGWHYIKAKADVTATVLSL